jgi:hypothetical protein
MAELTDTILFEAKVSLDIVAFSLLQPEKSIEIVRIVLKNVTFFSCALLCAAVRCCALLCAAVRCCALLCAAGRNFGFSLVILF